MRRHGRSQAYRHTPRAPSTQYIRQNRFTAPHTDTSKSHRWASTTTRPHGSHKPATPACHPAPGDTRLPCACEWRVRVVCAGGHAHTSNAPHGSGWLGCGRRRLGRRASGRWPRSRPRRTKIAKKSEKTCWARSIPNMPQGARSKTSSVDHVTDEKGSLFPICRAFPICK